MWVPKTPTSAMMVRVDDWAFHSNTACRSITRHATRPVGQGRGNVILFPTIEQNAGDGPIQCRERLGGLLKYYYRDTG
jgi:hypothetical protein